MKKILIVLSFFVLFSCEKESEQSNFVTNKSSVNVLSTDLVDNISEEVVAFHDYFINYFWTDIYEKGMTCDVDLLLYLRNVVIDKAKSYPFIYIDKDNFDKEYDSTSFVALCFDAMKYDTLNLSFAKSLYDKQLDVNFAQVEREANQAAEYLENAFYASSTPKEMEDVYKKYVEQRLALMKTANDYAILKFYTDMYLSSFTTWCNILYGDEENNAKKKESWLSSAWNSVKRTAKEVWKEVKPVVAADARGAATGAMVGLAGGAAGVGTGTLTGACVESSAKCIDKILGE